MRAPHHQYTWQQYLPLAADSHIKLEFLDGEIFAMAGGTPTHADLSLRLGSQLVAVLQGGPCRPYGGDLRVRVKATGLATYPDVTVVCGPNELDPDDRNTVLNPNLLVEVLSDSTERYDRGTKLQHYQQIETLQEVVLLSHREPRVEVFRREAEGSWSHHEARYQGQLVLVSVPCTLETDRLYAGLALG